MLDAQPQSPEVPLPPTLADLVDDGRRDAADQAHGSVFISTRLFATSAVPQGLGTVPRHNHLHGHPNAPTPQREDEHSRSGRRRAHDLAVPPSFAAMAGACRPPPRPAAQGLSWSALLHANEPPPKAVVRPAEVGGEEDASTRHAPFRLTCAVTVFIDSSGPELHDIRGGPDCSDRFHVRASPTQIPVQLRASACGIIDVPGLGAAPFNPSLFSTGRAMTDGGAAPAPSFAHSNNAQFQVAIPSISQALLWEVLPTSGLLAGMCAFIFAMHDCAVVYSQIDVRLRHLVHVRAGVLHGSPLLGSLFVSAFDPLLHEVLRKVEVDESDCLRSCTGDMVGVLPSVDRLASLAPASGSLCEVRPAGVRAVDVRLLRIVRRVRRWWCRVVPEQRELVMAGSVALAGQALRLCARRLGPEFRIRGAYSQSSLA